MKNSQFFIYNKYKFTLFQQRVITTILIKLFYNKKTTTFTIKAKDVITDIKPRMTFEDIRQETLTLLHKSYEIDEKRQFIQTSIFSSATFTKGQCLIKLTLSPAIIPYFEALQKEYSLVTIKDVIGFQSIYAIKIYLMLSKESRKGVFKIAISDLKARFNITNQYKDYNTFKNRVILQAQKELHNTHLAFSFQEVKEGRKVEFLIFKVLKINQITLSNQQNILAEKLIRELEVSSHQAKEIVVRFLPEEIHIIIYNIKERYRSGQIKNSLGAYSVGVFSHLLK
jgi:plasmid replication initiation protein